MATTELGLIPLAPSTSSGGNTSGIGVNGVLRASASKLAMRAGVIITVDDIAGDSMAIAQNNVFSLQAVDLVVIDNQGRVLPNLDGTSSQSTYYLDLNEIRLDQIQIEETNVDQSENALDLRLIPNPAADRTLINLSEALTSEGALEILTINGQILRTQIINPHQSVINLQVDDLASGVYIIRLKHDKGLSIQKLSVIHE